MSEEDKKHVTVVAEIGVNWKSLPEAIGMISSAKLAGADKCKFQCYDKSALKGIPGPAAARLTETQLNEYRCGRLMEAGEANDIPVFFTPMYPEAVEFLERLGVKTYKIRERDGAALVSKEGSASAVDPTPLIKKVMDTGKPIYISVQRKPLDQFFLHHPKISYLYCKPAYPARLEELELWRCAYNYGFSCHTPDIMAPITAAVLMQTNIEENTAKVIEVHVSNEPKADYLDCNVSFNFDELKTLVTMVRKAEKENVEYPY